MRWVWISMLQVGCYCPNNSNVIGCVCVTQTYTLEELFTDTHYYILPIYTVKLGLCYVHPQLLPVIILDS